MKRILSLSILFLCALAAKADEWVLVYEDNDMKVYFFDEIKKTKDGYKVWEEWVLKKPQKLDTRYFYSYKTYKEYNLDFDQHKIYLTVYYDKQGKKVVDSYEPSYPSWTLLIPGSIGYAVAEGIEYWIKN